MIPELGFSLTEFHFSQRLEEFEHRITLLEENTVDIEEFNKLVDACESVDGKINVMQKGMRLLQEYIEEIDKTTINKKDLDTIKQSIKTVTEKLDSVEKSFKGEFKKVNNRVKKLEVEIERITINMGKLKI